MGVNNIDLNVQRDFNKWNIQVENEVETLEKVVTECAAKGKNIIVIPVPDVPIAKSTAKAKKMQKTINANLNKMTENICKKYIESVKIVSLFI